MDDGNGQPPRDTSTDAQKKKASTVRAGVAPEVAPFAVNQTEATVRPGHQQKTS